MKPHSNGLFFSCAILLLCASGCDVLDRLFESGAERQRREEEDDAVAQAQAQRTQDLEQFLKTKSCIDCEITLDASRGTDLQKSVLTKSTVRCSDCKGVDLRGADFRNARLGGQLDGLDVRDSKMDAIVIRADSMKGMRMDKLDLRTMRAPEGNNWSGAILKGANLDGVSFMGARGQRGHFKTSDNPMNVGLGGTLAVGSDFRGAHLRKTNFGVCNLEGARFDNADADGIIIDLTNLKDASFVGANMQNAYAGTASAIGTNFSNVKAKGAHFAKANLTNAKFENADLRDANFKDAVIRGTRFDNADLSGATWIDGTRCKKGSIGKCRTR